MPRCRVHTPLVCAVLFVTLQIAAFAQSSGWLRPYPSQPYYWERIQERELATSILPRAPQVVAVAAVSESVTPGERIALVASVVWVFDTNNDPKGAAFKEITELRFVGADTAGVSFESRSAKQSAELSRCLATRLGTAVHFPDWGYQVLAGCLKEGSWESGRALRFPRSGSYQHSELPIAFEVTDGRLKVQITAPK